MVAVAQDYGRVAMRRFLISFSMVAFVLLGLVAIMNKGTSAQEATPGAMAQHPIVGSWIVDRNPDDPTEIPTYNVITADGGIIDPTVGGAGVWEATGPDTANFTLTGTIAEIGGYFLVYGSITIDPGEATGTVSYSSTIFAADGTVLDPETEGTALYTRLTVEPQGTDGPLAGFPVWTPASAATPAA
jgi:hypothetical protein